MRCWYVQSGQPPATPAASQLPTADRTGNSGGY